MQAQNLEDSRMEVVNERNESDRTPRFLTWATEWIDSSSVN